MKMSPMNLRYLAALCALFCSTCVTVESEVSHDTLVDDWRDEVIYQIMIDRFEDGDPNNNFNVDYRREASYHGGDWQGVIDRLDYIEALGVTALWISPVVRNVEEDAGFASYHGYWTQDFMRPNPHFGDIAKLQELVRECHARDIKVILDIVTNHVGQLFYYDINRNYQPDTVFFGGGGAGAGSQTDAVGNQGSDLRRSSEWDPEFDFRRVQGFTSLGENGDAPLVFVENPEINRTPPNPPEFRNPDWYNRRGRVTVWEDECACFRAVDGGSCDGLYNPWKSPEVFDCFERLREQEIKGDFPGGLKDLDTSRPDVRQALIKVFQYWIEVSGIDGFRIDTLKHQAPEFFEVFAPAMRAHARRLGKRNFFMFGEAFDGKDFLLGEYTHGQGVDSVFYFSAKYQIFDGVFGRSEATAKVRELYEGRNADQVYGDGTQTRSRYSREAKENGITDSEGNPLNSQQLLVHFMDNHDVPRWLYSFNGQMAAYRNGLSFLLTTDGIPCLYYGAEQDFAGGPDPSNREDMWLSGFATNGETFVHIQRLIALRKQLAPLRRGDLNITYTSNHSAQAGEMNAPEDAGLLAFERNYGGQTVLVIFNTHPEQTSRSGQGMNLLETSFGPNQVLRDVLGGTEDIQTSASGSIDIRLPPNSARVYVLADAP